MTLAALTPAERHTLALLVRLGSVKHVALRLGRSPRTIQQHTEAIRRKCGSPYAACYELGLATPRPAKAPR